ncbi:NupC/NupG family nucleoside CNT transporter [candidate division KSB1 bacterium]|nr:NupC/NupG family nucleoside CNT transporter [candidate division KSB1 bacterium]NIR70355.1 NupC/NupG family nucleoside CNT transporter [candidate division KSB1 bacterium]NIS24479.1 NupC/NupG family nucleoside CNT transporter [candidate division KSB1 bacterium]NIT71407.1 NupC/NupG family nucleoside CNT transporter [candidate division KSB1 bacterium]NIU23542.1 NupC/NupG family nucleoside CNT transporter [candidate division KSB1 bacterium]
MGAIIVLSAAVISLLTYYLDGFGAAVPILLLSLLGIGWAFYKKDNRLQRYSIAAFLTLGFGVISAKGLYGRIIFKVLSEKVDSFLKLTDFGSTFLFGKLANTEYVSEFGFQFAFAVLPTIIFFAAFMSILYYFGVIQVVVEIMAKFMRWTMGTSGAETLSCTSNIFVGQTEAPLLIKPFLKDMTVSELATIMVGGFATIAGGVLAAYIRMGIDPGHLIAASVMSAPAALVIGKIIHPEIEHSLTAGDVKIPKVKTANNLLEAASNGITDGLKLAVNVAAMLVGFIALIALLDVILNYFDSLIDGKLLGGAYVTSEENPFSPVKGEHSGIFPGSLRTLFGNSLRYLAFVMGTPWEDSITVGNLLGLKLAVNELVAYGTLGAYISEDALSPRSVVIATYALCGFANFASIGIQIGGIGAIAPERRRDLAKVGLKAMFGGALASWMTATIAGVLLQ